MKLSVIIVNYNVKHFLEQCLQSCLRASENMAVETIVVDNASVDGSERLVREKFPTVTYLYQPDNLGFSKANNLGIGQSSGEYVLLLNPDTIVAEDTFKKCIAFMDAHPQAGGLGVKMIDGNGNFLPESKRGLPTPAVAFFKIFGLSSLFPKSRLFGRYHLGFLDPDQVHEVDILSGAFMLMRREALDKTGLLDETFFMYGEDIDLSYRIKKAGYKNFYFPETTIVHYKGESTKKSSVNYVFVFYRAMVIFARKHFTSQHAGVFSFLIHVAIYFRAGIAIARRLLEKALLPLLDFVGIWLFLHGTTDLYGDLSGKVYDPHLTAIALPAFSALWAVANFFTGIYHAPFKWKNLLTGVVAGGTLMLVSYSLLPEELRFSRAVILIGAIGAFVVVATIRILAHFLPFVPFTLHQEKPKRIAVVAGLKDFKRIQHILEDSYKTIDFAAPVHPDARLPHPGQPFMSNISQLAEVVRVFQINEVIFSGEDLQPSQILKNLARLHKEKIACKIAPANAGFIIGSNSVHANNMPSSHAYFLSLGNEAQQRNKRLFDIFFSLVLLATLPFNIWFVDNKAVFLSNILKVLFGKFTWIGYDGRGTERDILPKMRQGILHPNLHIITGQNAPATLNNSNFSYARNYRWWHDIGFTWKYFHALGRNAETGQA